MFSEIIRSYCDNHDKHIIYIYIYIYIYTEMQNIEFVNINTGGTYYFLCALKFNTQLISMILLYITLVYHYTMSLPH
jgi:hypothetical protein